uniref:Unspecific monooxygenase n=1 Tax=Opuntia streptacantha TaxID=393608 RepID=A0A7C9E1Z0_OPUST
MVVLNPFDLFFSFSLTLFILSFAHILLIPKTPKRKHYGPPTYPILGCLISFYKNRRRLLDWYTDLLARSPSQTIEVTRLGARRIILTANPANVEYILKTNFHNFPKGEPLNEILGDLLGHGIFNVDGELWATQRKLASHEFTTKSLKEFVVKALEDEVEGRLIPLLQAAAQTNQIIDLQEVLKRLTYDTICKVSLGSDPNCLDLSAPIPPLIKAFDSAAAISAMRATSPVYLIWKLKRALNIGSEQQLKQSINTVHSVVQDIIDDKQKALAEGQAPNEDLLSRFLSAGHDRQLARDMVVSFIMAGRDTTAAAMTWLFYLLSAVDPTAREEIRAELAWAATHVDDSSHGPCPGQLGYEALRKDMKYLQACLCETMRLYPPVAWDSKHALNDDVLPDGTKVNEGDRVTYFPYGMGRMETIWGKDWFEFRPDRWFDQTGRDDQPVQGGEKSKRFKMRSPYEFPVFQAGPRVCLGKEMAFIQMKYVVASVISRFDFEPVCSDPPVFVPLLTAHMAGGFKVRVKERRS